jgi:hypothetical protein
VARFAAFADPAADPLDGPGAGLSALRSSPPQAASTNIRTASNAVRRTLDHLTPNLLNLGQESVVCSHALRGGDWVWLA